jgi:hypothetical protein
VYTLVDNDYSKGEHFWFYTQLHSITFKSIIVLQCCVYQCRYLHLLQSTSSYNLQQTLC